MQSLSERWAPYCVSYSVLKFEKPNPDVAGEAYLPRLDQEVPSTVFYLFRRNPKTGEIDSEPSGTGCFVLRRSEGTPGFDHIYAVSNWHVTQDAGASIIRVNTSPGKSRTIEFDPSEWTFKSDADDLSVLDVTDHLSIATDQFACIDALTEDAL